jgi:hypothetical protein
MKSIRLLRKAFERTILSRIVGDACQSKAPEMHAPTPPPQRRERAQAKRPDYAMEVLEPRLLLAADISYVPNAAHLLATNFTLRLVDDGGLKVRMFDDLNNNVSESAFSLTETEINVTRDGGAIAGAAFGDTVNIDLSTFQYRNSAVDPGTLTVRFTGGFKDELLPSDNVVLKGSNTLDYGLSILSDADIEVDATVNLVTTKDVNLAVAKAARGLTVTNPGPGPGPDQDFVANSSAKLDFKGTLSAQNVKLTATSDVVLDNTGLGLGGLQLAFIVADSSAAVDIGFNANITTTGSLTVVASSSVVASASLASLATKTDTSTDAAVASVVVSSDAQAKVKGNA